MITHDPRPASKCRAITAMLSYASVTRENNKAWTG